MQSPGPGAGAASPSVSISSYDPAALASDLLDDEASTSKGDAAIASTTRFQSSQSSVASRHEERADFKAAAARPAAAPHHGAPQSPLSAATPTTPTLTAANICSLNRQHERQQQQQQQHDEQTEDEADADPADGAGGSGSSSGSRPSLPWQLAVDRRLRRSSASSTHTAARSSIGSFYSCHTNVMEWQDEGPAEGAGSGADSCSDTFEPGQVLLLGEAPQRPRPPPHQGPPAVVLRACSSGAAALDGLSRGAAEALRPPTAAPSPAVVAVDVPAMLLAAARRRRTFLDALSQQGGGGGGGGGGRLDAGAADSGTAVHPAALLAPSQVVSFKVSREGQRAAPARLATCSSRRVDGTPSGWLACRHAAQRARLPADTASSLPGCCASRGMARTCPRGITADPLHNRCRWHPRRRWASTSTA
jgi:hypothetical protein